MPNPIKIDTDNLKPRTKQLKRIKIIEIKIR